jgi:ribosomal protein L24
VSAKLKVKKGDLVQMLTGKDRGKQGRVLEVRKGDRRVIVENLNVVKRPPAPEADEGPEPDGRAADRPRRDHRQGRRRCRSRT